MLFHETLERLAPHVESLIFAADSPVSREEIRLCLEETLQARFQPEEIEAAIQQLIARYEQDAYAFEIVEIAGGLQFLTKPPYQPTIGAYLRQTTRKRLSRAALAPLSIIAYKQPASKLDIERIRGVSSEYSLQKLLEKELVSIVGRAEGPGRPLLYGTSEKFMHYFGIKSLQDLPKLKDFKEPDFEIGQQAPIEEDTGEEAES
jgi:segregation and condensation protein B